MGITLHDSRVHGNKYNNVHYFLVLMRAHFVKPTTLIWLRRLRTLDYVRMVNLTLSLSLVVVVI